MIDLFFKSVVTGIARRWKMGLAQALSVIGAIWLVTEIATTVSTPMHDWLTHNGASFVIFVGLAAATWFFAYSYEARSVSFLVPTTDSKITIRYGNLLNEDADWLIGVNEFFDSEIGHIVSQASLHGQFITVVYGGDSSKFRTDIDRALNRFEPTQTTRSISPSKSYPIGTTAVLPNGRHKTFLVAMTHTDLETAKASSTVPMLWIALKGALESINSYGNGAPLSLPLIGNGRSSVNIEPQHLLRLIVLALVDFGRKVGLPKSIAIVLPEACFDLLDIREIERDWRAK